LVNVQAHTQINVHVQTVPALYYSRYN